MLVVGSTSLYTPAASEAAYRASKAALKAYAEVLALELALHGVRVNVLTPGAFRTPLTAHMSAERRAELVSEIPLRREGITDELCATALLLLSDKLSPYTTGAEFVVDGGLRLRALSLQTT
jgi:3-oxoacyl-[acyl-carrier protein] reductase